MDAATLRQAIKEAVELNKQWNESGNTKGEPLRLSGLDLSYVNFEGCDLTGANFRKANIDKAKFDWVDFTRADLTGATFLWKGLTEASVVSERTPYKGRQQTER